MGKRRKSIDCSTITSQQPNNTDSNSNINTIHDDTTNKNSKTKANDDIDEIFTDIKKTKYTTTVNTSDNNNDNSNNHTSDYSDDSDAYVNSEDEDILQQTDKLSDNEATKLIAKRVRLAKSKQQNKHINNNNNKHNNNTKHYNNKRQQHNSIPKDDMGFTRNSSVSGNALGYTDEGYKIYHETDLKINQPNSGSTALCPFDCQCCF